MCSFSFKETTHGQSRCSYTLNREGLGRNLAWSQFLWDKASLWQVWWLGMWWKKLLSSCRADAFLVPHHSKCSLEIRHFLPAFPTDISLHFPLPWAGCWFGFPIQCLGMGVWCLLTATTSLGSPCVAPMLLLQLHSWGSLSHPGRHTQPQLVQSWVRTSDLPNLFMGKYISPLSARKFSVSTWNLDWLFEYQSWNLPT